MSRKRHPAGHRQAGVALQVEQTSKLNTTGQHGLYQWAPPRHLDLDSIIGAWLRRTSDRHFLNSHSTPSPRGRHNSPSPSFRLILLVQIPKSTLTYICKSPGMPNKLSDWIHRKAAQRQYNGKANAHKERENSLKELCLSNIASNTHHRPLTPTAQFRSDSDWTRNNGSFFELPANIREKIITAAFGDGGLHLVLEYRQAYQRNPQSHAGFWPGQSASGPSSDGEWDTSSIKTWKWRSCVCHRERPTRKWSAMHISLDGCLQGEPMSCAYWQIGEPMPGKCLVGVMGWLLSCRQS